MTPQAFTTIALLMGVCIMWGMVFSIFFNKKYLASQSAEEKRRGGRRLRRHGHDRHVHRSCQRVHRQLHRRSRSGAGRFTFAGSWMPLAVVAVSAAVVAVFVWLAEKKNAAWVDNFSIGGSRFAGMAAAVLLRGV